MNTGIKNKLKTLIGEEVEISNQFSGISIYYPSEINLPSYKILRIEDEDCVVIEDSKCEKFLSIDHITTLTVKRI